MLTLPCPFCGQRDETEFFNAGPTKPPRPDAKVTDSEWIDWLTVPVNPIGYVEEKLVACKRGVANGLRSIATRSRMMSP